MPFRRVRTRRTRACVRRTQNAVLSAGLDRHIGDGHAVIHGQRGDPGAVELHGAIGGAVESDLADAVEDDVLGHHARLELAFDPEMHRLGDLDEETSGAHDESGVGVADAGGELVEGAGHAGGESVPKSTSPGGWPFWGRAVWQTPA